MAQHWITWPAPTLPDNVDAAVRYTLGNRFTVASDMSCVGVRWRNAATAQTGEPGRIGLWDTAGVLLASSDAFTYGAGDAGNDSSALFTTPYALTAGVTYVVGRLTWRYVATANYSWPVTQAPLTAVVANGWLRDTTIGLVAPTIQSGNASNFHISPIVDDGVAPVQLDAALPVTVGLTATLRQVVQLSAALAVHVGLNALLGGTTVPPTHTGTITRPSAGTIARPDSGVVAVPRKTYP